MQETSEKLSLAELEAFDPYAPCGRTHRRFLCPFCGKDKPRDSNHRSISVYLETMGWKCHRCGRKGRLTGKSDQPWNNVSAFDIQIAAPVATPPKNLSQLQESYSRVFPHSPGETYLRSRKVDAQIAAESGVGYCSKWKHWEKARFGGEWRLRGSSRRVTFPVWDQAGQLVALQGRAIDKNDFGVKAITKGPKSQGVFLTPKALDVEPVAVTEAPIDALTLAMCGMPAMATMGTSWPQWLPRACIGAEIVIATDADQPGEEYANKLIRVFASVGATPIRVRPPQHIKDWNECLQQHGVEATREYLKSEIQRYKETFYRKIRV